VTHKVKTRSPTRFEKRGAALKGIVFNLLQEAVLQKHGEDVWDDLLEEAQVDGAFTSLGSYPDDTMSRLIAVAAKRLEQPPQELIRWFGETAFPLLAARVPKLMTNYQSVRPFLLSLNDIIHPEVRKIYPGAATPEFDFSESTGDTLMMAYSSQRRLCAFAEGLIRGAANHFEQAIELDHATCLLRGDPRCLFQIRFP
jgi:hypothetical protein